MGNPLALLVFADIIDSSKFSAVLSYEAYKERVLDFQDSFRRLGDRYFQDLSDPALEYRSVEARGDEGIAFAIYNDVSPERLVLLALDFVTHLKGYLRLTNAAQTGQEVVDAPSRIGIGAGIHIGKVATIDGLDKNGRSIIQKIEGFEINKAKRVETSSRDGICSRIMLSEDACRFIEGASIAKRSLIVPMKGIAERVRVFEFEAGFLGPRLDRVADERDAHLLEKVCELAEYPSLIDEQWLKSFVISLLDKVISDPEATSIRDRCRDLQQRFAWKNCNEDDPILLYVRARMAKESCCYTQQIRYLRDILQAHPTFLLARKEMVFACHEISKLKSVSAEKIYARDLAAEFLERFDQLLSEEERNGYKRVLAELSAPSGVG